VILAVEFRTPLSDIYQQASRLGLKDRQVPALAIRRLETDRI
jgi:hypothetical protein